jgi:hypothetical protein
METTVEQKWWWTMAWISMPMPSLMLAVLSLLTLSILPPFMYKQRPNVIRIQLRDLFYFIATQANNKLFPRTPPFLCGENIVTSILMPAWHLMVEVVIRSAVQALAANSQIRPSAVKTVSDMPYTANPVSLNVIEPNRFISFRYLLSTCK